LSKRLRPLGSTYRLQLHGIGFEGARRLVGYLSDLGIETLYVSPVLAAVPGSTHSYDVVDPTWLDPALGTAEDFAGLLEELAAHRMRLLLDIVPNHMATAPENRWWWDVLARGQRSPGAPWFDVDWAQGGGKVVLAVLEAPLSEMLGAGAIGVDRAAGLVSVATSAYPLDPETVVGEHDVASVLERQHYRLAYWRVGPRETNYRRFFDIDQLVGVRVEDPDVYRATHAFVLELAADPRVAGLRVDHVDGLADPAAYLGRLHADLDAARSEPAHVVVEKILGAGESLPADWPVDGTTGYEFASLTTRLFVDPAGASAIEELGAALTGETRKFDEIAKEARAEVLLSLFPGQADRLARLAHGALWRRDPGCDLTFDAVRRALGALVANLDVYRTYLDGRASATDRRRLEGEVSDARSDLDADGARALDALGALLLEDRSEPVAVALRLRSGRRRRALQSPSTSSTRSSGRGQNGPWARSTRCRPTTRSGARTCEPAWRRCLRSPTSGRDSCVAGTAD
jgi:(1->4)-alpha-D-glucan 1-alpha-D-glucosylmutase